MREVSGYYQLGLGQLHSNGWTIFSFFENFYWIIGLEHMVKVCISYYQLVTSIHGSNDMQWFFNFANRNNGIMKNMLAKKMVHVKKSRGIWLVIRFIGIINLREGLRLIWGFSHD